ncbi:hypothetical protein [Chryseobacterium koreense]|uniref:Uncharacterized protein n=1 Tax=Chryseobacterium koreense CCUG 49689 TaxID=1304281 RepID=A0A0J7J034_9FLAO|nr:hypothetical protein [Chryseobacterium koreense]KMQ71602.1 hypothetical protein ACM44_05040 [Chryseobacterium koreense CCUG 49689]MBB5333283.1 hypothetical protein [Chryseobacterium koreense]
MKNIFKLSFIFLFAILSGQNISDYQYIFIPKEFANAKANKYGLSDLLAKKLKSKKYVILTDPIQTSCESLHAEIVDTGNFLTNKVRVDFKDCQNKTIATFDGKSNLKELEEGMQNALENAMKGINVSNPVTHASSQMTEPTETVSKNENANPKPKTETQNGIAAQNNAEVYTNGTLTLNKIKLSENQFILANPNQSVPYAVFSATSKKDVYRVQLENGTATFGYFENGNIVIETPNSDGSFGKQVFSRK